MLIIVGTLFIANIQIKKPPLRVLAVLCALVIVAMAVFIAVEFDNISLLAF